MAEGFVEDDYLKPAVLDVIDSSQLQYIWGSPEIVNHFGSNKHVANMAPGDWRKRSDCKNPIVWLSRGFRLIDHSILVNKLRNFAVPWSI